MAGIAVIGRRCSIPTAKQRYSVWVLAVLLLIGAPAAAAIWGVKSHDPVSGPPATLFHLAENGTGFQTVSTVRLLGSAIDVDCLAMTPQADVYGFQLDSSGSTLIRINKNTASASVVGVALAGRDIRGAVFCRSGKLAALDAAGDELLCIDPMTGAVVGSPTLLTLAGERFDVPNHVDLAQRNDGLVLISGLGPECGSFYAVDTVTGVLEEFFTDSAAMPDGEVPCVVGVAFSRAASLYTTVFAYDVSLSDDLVAYETVAPFTRSTLMLDIVSSYNAGRGDLAAQLDPPTGIYGVSAPASEHIAAVRGSFMFRFVLWGIVREATVGSFKLDDGSGCLVTVMASQYAGLANGNYARAEGVLHHSPDGPVLLCAAENIKLVK